MRDNSGQGESKNNLHDPHLKDLEREKGTSGEAIQGEKKAGSTPDRKSTAGA